MLTIEILTRTHHRPREFRRCRDSVLRAALDFPGRIIHHAIMDDLSATSYARADRTTLVTPTGDGKYPRVNGYFNQVALTPDAWILHLDDDDEIVGPLAALAPYLGNPRQMLLWRVRIGSRIFPPPELWGRPPRRGKISGIGFMVHQTHWLRWPQKRAADWSVIDRLYRRLPTVWIPEVLTAAQRT